ncbi:iron-sulfur cluster biosynthesis family protein [Paenibacillus sp. TSA_86.1]|uniref:iron-sulfur cluster biosynthesis family protein n=1 Tax=Paenibacillus sp. TSA_86.1 TaxID=3415649 RepID=UPI0040465C2F
MIIQVSPQAEARLVEQLDDRPGFFKLFYDTDGCGCDGITVLLILNERDSEDVSVEAGSLPFVINKQQQTYFEPCLRLQSENNFPSFRLSSDSMIYGSNIKVHDLRDVTNVTPESADWSIQ